MTVTYVLERNHGLGDRYQIRNDFSDSVKRAGDDLQKLAAYLFEYSAYQGTRVAFDLLDQDYAELALALGTDEMPGFE